tara:strand:+ start:1203 stop:3590 length:2388 start_codon:yes stop_codon:yes gene_type:complete
MANYFSHIPFLAYVSRDKERNTLNDYTIVKNLFKRGKIREDIFQNVSYFTKYQIVGDERPDQVAAKIYDDPTLDWVVLLANNIQNVYEEWPKTQVAFDKHMIQKYGSYEELYSVHHYETLTRKSEDDYTIVESGIEVNEGFFKAPEYEIEQDKSVILPSEVPGTFAEATATVDPVSGEVTKLVLTNAGAGYTAEGIKAEVSIAPPPTPRVGILSVSLNPPPDDREVGPITIVDAGGGYTYQPAVSFSDPPPTIPPQLEAVIGVGGTIESVQILNAGDGYTFTPTITFPPPPNIIENAIFESASPFTVESGFEGMFLDALGVRLFTAHGANSYTVGKIQQYQLTSSHDMSTGSFVRELTLNIDNLTFQYATSVEFKPDGTRMYVSGLTNSGNKVAQYDLSTAWDISTASLDIAISMPAISSVRLQDTGEHMFILDTADPDTLKKYNMVTPWDIGTMFPLPVQTQNLTVITQPAESSIRGLSFKDDGSKMYVSGTDNQSMFVIGLGTNWDLDTLTFIGVLNVASASGDSTPLDTFTNFADTRFLIGGSILRKVFTYTTDVTATATAEVGIGTRAETLININVVKPGAGYTTSALPTIQIQPPIPHRTAKGYVTITNGSVASIVMQDRGYNYRTAPTATIQNPLAPITAEGVVKAEDGKITEISLTNPGRGYQTPPVISFSQPGPTYIPSVDEVYERNGQEWKFDGYNWRRRLSYGTVYFDNIKNELVEIPGKIASTAITNYEYEERLENKKRNIYILKPELLSLVNNDMDNIMPYKKGSGQYVNPNLKRGDNPRLYD